MNEKLELVLAWITVVMPLVLAGAHGLKTGADKLHSYALSTKDKRDDRVTERLVHIAGWLEYVAGLIAHASSLGFFARPARKDSK